MAIIKRSSYYNPDYRQGPALIRARSPYLIKNALTGLAICGFTVAVYVYTIKAIKSDDFADAALPAPVMTPATGVDKKQGGSEGSL